MASTFKTFLNNDVAQTKTLLHEAIPITGSLISGTYAGAYGSETHIKNYSHAMFQSVYDYPHASSSANHIFDITFGYSSASAFQSTTSSQNTEKMQIYNQMAQVLMGFKPDGSLRAFDEDGNLTGGNKIYDAYFINFSRLLVKDEIKKGSFSMTLLSDHAYESAGGAITIEDTNAANEFRVNSPAGEYGILYADDLTSGRSFETPSTLENPPIGLIFYQAGVVVLSMANADDYDGVTPAGPSNQIFEYNAEMNSTAGDEYHDILTGSSIQLMADALRHRIDNITFNNTTELNSSIYFCRANHNDYNYSSNPTYLTGSKIMVKEKLTDQPVSYITSVGLYSADNELLAVAKLSEPLKKTPSTELTLRVRLDY